jgi:hypothetical protein
MGDNGSLCLTSTDCTDMAIWEPRNQDGSVNPYWFSYKLKRAGVRYEVCLCIQTGWIVWIHGPFPCGWGNDKDLAYTELVAAMEEDERSIADGVYNDGEVYFITPSGYNNDTEWMRSMVRSRHENVNTKFKVFRILTEQFRHDLSLHGYVFSAIANITQIKIETDEPLTQVYYNNCGIEDEDDNESL